MTGGLVVAAALQPGFHRRPDPEPDHRLQQRRNLVEPARHHRSLDRPHLAEAVFRVGRRVVRPGIGRAAIEGQRHQNPETVTVQQPGVGQRPLRAQRELGQGPRPEHRFRGRPANGDVAHPGQQPLHRRRRILAAVKADAAFQRRTVGTGQTAQQIRPVGAERVARHIAQIVAEADGDARRGPGPDRAALDHLFIERPAAGLVIDDQPERRRPDPRRRRIAGRPRCGTEHTLGRRLGVQFGGDLFLLAVGQNGLELLELHGVKPGSLRLRHGLCEHDAPPCPFWMNLPCIECAAAGARS
ncbi:hypothetical protein RNZ50_10175 [Paracoccaceae bacterium Fryx2]|nr:hypothetical protein [Paracoccaceae bacterium Fryx2]